MLSGQMEGISTSQLVGWFLYQSALCIYWYFLLQDKLISYFIKFQIDKTKYPHYALGWHYANKTSCPNITFRCQRLKMEVHAWRKTKAHDQKAAPMICCFLFSTYFDERLISILYGDRSFAKYCCSQHEMNL